MKDSKRYPKLSTEQLARRTQRDQLLRFQTWMEEQGWKQRIIYWCGFCTWTKGDDIVQLDQFGYQWNGNRISTQEFYKKVGYK